MCPDPHTSSDVECMRERLLAEMRRYCGKRGIYAAEMLETARLLLGQPEQHPRQAEAAAYCIRQAVKEIFGDTRDRNLLPGLVKRLVATKDSMQTANAVGAECLHNMYRAVDDLKDFVCSPKPEACLKEIFRRRSGIDPEDGLIQEYRRILKTSNCLLHDVLDTRTGAGKVRDHYEDAVDVLSLIFLPTERLARIERLAELPAPQRSDLNELRRIMNNAYGFDYFARRMRSPMWFAIMEPDMLKSSSGNPPWLLGSLAKHLKDVHVDAFVRMLENNFDRWASDDVGLGKLGFVGYKLGDSGLPWLVKTLQVSKRARMERDRKIKIHSEASTPDAELIKEMDRIRDSIWYLDYYARLAFSKTKRPNPLFVELAEHLLSSDSTVNSYRKPKILAKLVGGMDRASAIRIVEILVRELRTKPESGQRLLIPRLDSVDEPNYDRSFGINGLVASLRSALAKARDLDVSTPRLIRELGSLSEAAKPRFEAWLYSRADDIDSSEIVRYMVDSCNSRPSNDEDDLLLTRLKRDGRMADISDHIIRLLGRAPDTKKMSGSPRQWGIGTEEYRHILWARTLRPWIRLPDEWKRCLDMVDSYEAEYSSGGKQAPEVLRSQDNVVLLDGSCADDPPDAAAKTAAESPDAGVFLEPVDRRSPVAAIDKFLREYQPNASMLEKYRDMVLDAVKRDVPGSLIHLLHGLLWGTRGYDPEYIAKKLMNIGPEYVSKAGWAIFNLLDEGARADHVQRGTAFWASVLGQSPKPEALAGFGLSADVSGIDQERWEELMLCTCKMAEKMEWSHGVAERISTSPTLTDTGWQILAQLFSIDLGYDRDEVAKYAMDALRKTVSIDAPESRSHLREVLADNGFPDAREL